MNIIEGLKKVEPKSMHHPLPIEWREAIDDIIIDTYGKKYIDFTSTIFVQNVGHSNERVKRYLKNAIDNNLLHTYTFAHEMRLKFLNKLIECTPSYLEKAFMLSSGTESTECAIKLMKMYTGKKKILSIKGSMHGRTLGAEYMKHGGHEDFIVLPYPKWNTTFGEQINKIKDVSDIGGIMIETYQGWSAKFLPQSYVDSLKTFASGWGIPICFDEVQAGFWRTGKQFGYEHYNIEPDLVCIGKAIGGGLPLSGVLGRKEIMDIPDVGDMSSTHSANPLCCASGLAVLEELEMLDKEELERKSEILKETLRSIFENEYVVEVNFNGLLGGIVFDSEVMATNVCKRCLEEGLLVVHTGRESVKIGPPLIISEHNLKLGLKILDAVIY